MTTATEESFLNDLELSLKEAWKLLIDGKKDRTSPLHTPVVASVDSNGNPSQRVMVLRKVDRENRLLRFNTDLRATKVAEIGEQAAISILCYHPAAKTQLRLTGSGRIETQGPAVDENWENATLYGKRCYLAYPAPGSVVDRPTSGLHPDLEGQKPSADKVAPARSNFAILLAEIERIEWLYLAHTGHRRARYIWDDDAGAWESEWLVP